MRSLIAPVLFALLVPTFVACSGDDGGGAFGKPVCSDGQDNDGDGMTDFPDDLGCDRDDDDTEDSLVSPQCKDGRDNDGDGKKDFPNDPGCQSASDTVENTVCPGTTCPACADGIDNDSDSRIDFPMDTTCLAAASPSEACPELDPIAEQREHLAQLDLNGARE